MMAYINMWQGVLASYNYFLAGDSGFRVLNFCQRHPAALRDLALFCACGAFGQLFIFLSIHNFGSLTNTTITTTRKFFNILLSVAWNGTVLLPQQWAGAVMVLGGLMASSVLKELKKRRAKRQEDTVARSTRGRSTAKKENGETPAAKPRHTPSRSPMGRTPRGRGKKDL